MTTALRSKERWQRSTHPPLSCTAIPFTLPLTSHARLSPFFSFYGAKYKAAKHYPEPRHDTIIEPFAGAAGYSILHWQKNVLLYDIDPNIVRTWDYLIHVGAPEIMSLPLLDAEQSVDDLDITPEARLLIGWWLNEGSAMPKKSKPRGTRCGLGWSEKTKWRIANQLHAIRHWRVDQVDYRHLGNKQENATWFVDPPYQKAGKHYRFGSKLIDYDELFSFVAGLRGQVIVCENDGADWLPFTHLTTIGAQAGKQKKSAVSAESMLHLESWP